MSSTKQGLDGKGKGSKEAKDVGIPDPQGGLRTMTCWEKTTSMEELQTVPLIRGIGDIYIYIYNHPIGSIYHLLRDSETTIDLRSIFWRI